MFRQTIARVFCFLTVFLLSGNVVLSAVPEIKTEKYSRDRQQTISPYVEIDHDSTFLAEKDPFEDFDFLIEFPVYSRIIFAEVLSVQKKNHFYQLSGPHFKSEPIWLLVKHIRLT
jgi:hypothetical protein